MEELEKKLGYTFRDPSLLQGALYHSSYANEHRGQHIASNERLEFLGTRCWALSPPSTCTGSTPTCRRAI